MSVYKLAIGHDVALVSLVEINPQPMSGGVMTIERTYGTSGDVHEQGLYVELELEITKSDAAYLAYLTLFGLHAAISVLVTIYAPNSVGVWTRYNGRAVRPEVGKDVKRVQGWMRKITILIKELESI